MRILFYTRLEGNTAGDETFLKTLKFYLTEKLTDETEVNLCLSYDSVSEKRALRIGEEWQDALNDKKLTGQIFFFLTTERSFEKSVLPVKCRYLDWNKIKITENALKSLDESLTWYIKSKNEFYVRSTKQNIPLLKMEINGDIGNLKLEQRKCYASLEMSENKKQYPLYVIEIEKYKVIENDKEVEKKRVIAFLYYKSSDSLAMRLPPADSTIGKGLFALISRFDKKPVVQLSESEVQGITSLTSYIPDELLITESEYNAVEENLKIPDDLTYERAKWLAFERLTASLDLFVMAGWAHLQSKTTATYLKSALHLPSECKILLSCVPGMSVNAFGFVTELQKKPSYENLYVMQTGIGVSGGFPLLPVLTREGIDRQQVRDAWMEYASQYKEYMSETGEVRKDKLIVIYCSKDAPGLSGSAFLQKISQENIETNDYHVLLIGADPTSDAYKVWERLCKLRGFNYTALARTESINDISGTEILMRGLRDAEFSMATGSYSILEARYLGIDHCVYLSPPHMKQLGDMLEKAPPESIEHAFKLGRRALEELGQLLSPEKYQGDLFKSDLAWNLDNSSEWKICWQKYLDEALKRKPSANIEVITYKM